MKTKKDEPVTIVCEWLEGSVRLMSNSHNLNTMKMHHGQTCHVKTLRREQAMLWRGLLQDRIILWRHSSITSCRPSRSLSNSAEHGWCLAARNRQYRPREPALCAHWCPDRLPKNLVWWSQLLLRLQNMEWDAALRSRAFKRRLCSNPAHILDMSRRERLNIPPKPRGLALLTLQVPGSGVQRFDSKGHRHHDRGYSITLTFAAQHGTGKSAEILLWPNVLKWNYTLTR